MREGKVKHQRRSTQMQTKQDLKLELTKTLNPNFFMVATIS
jgi:hypothetical protein